MSCDVGKAAEELENELWRRWSGSGVGEATEGLRSLILQPSHRFTYVTAHSPTLPRLYLRHSSFYSPFVCFTYVIGTSPTLPGEPPMPLWWCLIYPWWFCNQQWLRPARLFERCKLALELKRLKTPGLGKSRIWRGDFESPRSEHCADVPLRTQEM